MSDPIQFTVYGTAQPAGSKRAFRNKYSGHINVVDANPKAAKWKDQVAQRAGEVMNGRELLRGPLKARFVFHFKRPKGHFGRRGLLPSAPAFPTGRPDVLKAARGVEDSLKGVVYFDDAQIVLEVLEKHYGEPERCEVTIRTLEAQVSAVPDAQQTSLLAGSR